MICASSLGPPFYSVVSLQTPEELDDSDFETEDFDVRSRTSVQTEDDQLIAGQSARVSTTFPLVVLTDIPMSALHTLSTCPVNGLTSSLVTWHQIMLF